MLGWSADRSDPTSIRARRLLVRPTRETDSRLAGSVGGAHILTKHNRLCRSSPPSLNGLSTREPVPDTRSSAPRVVTSRRRGLVGGEDGVAGDKRLKVSVA
jgi:hypothetical protein